jgi:hypothetical protein
MQEKENNMSIVQTNTMHVLDGAVHKYEDIGETSTECAVRDLLTDLRHYCDLHDIDFDERSEGSLEVYLEEKDLEEE